MKGVWRTIESVIAITILMSFMLYFGNPVLLKEQVDPTSKGYEILKIMDSNNELRTFVENKDWSSLNNRIHMHGYNHTVEICNQTACYGEYPNVENIWVSSYIISGHGKYEPCRIKLYMW